MSDIVNKAAKEKTRPAYFVFGDIHGYLDKLKELMEKVIREASPDDTFVFLGDYIDRGPDSKGVVDLLIHFSKSWERSVFLKGNHEDMLLDYAGLSGHHGESYLQNGARTTFQSYNGLENIPQNHFAFFRKLESLHVCEEYPYIFVHAGLKPQVPIEEQNEVDLFWIRRPFIDYDGDWEDSRKVIYGHTPARGGLPRIDDNKIGIDTGVAYGGPLTAIKLPGEKIFQSK